MDSFSLDLQPLVHPGWRRPSRIVFQSVLQEYDRYVQASAMQAHAASAHTLDAAAHDGGFPAEFFACSADQTMPAPQHRRTTLCASSCPHAAGLCNCDPGASIFHCSDTCRMFNAPIVGDPTTGTALGIDFFYGERYVLPLLDLDRRPINCGSPASMPVTTPAPHTVLFS